MAARAKLAALSGPELAAHGHHKAMIELHSNAVNQQGRRGAAFHEAAQAHLAEHHTAVREITNSGKHTSSLDSKSHPALSKVRKVEN